MKSPHMPGVSQAGHFRARRGTSGTRCGSLKWWLAMGAAVLPLSGIAAVLPIDPPAPGEEPDDTSCEVFSVLDCERQVLVLSRPIVG